MQINQTPVLVRFIIEIPMSMKKIVVAVTGASGSVYAKVLFDKLKGLEDQISEIGIIMSDNAKDVWLH